MEIQFSVFYFTEIWGQSIEDLFWNRDFSFSFADTDIG